MQDKETVAVLIGNSDNKLSQWEWSEFVTATKMAITMAVSDSFGGVPWFFTGGSSYDAPYQNACFVFEIRSGVETKKLKLRELLSQTARDYHQESIAILAGQSELVFSGKGN